MTGIVEKSESYDGIVGMRLSRRAALMGLASTAALLATPAMWPKSAKAAGSSLSFAELTRIYDQTHHVAPDYNANILIRWGDPIARDVTFDPAALTADNQAKQFGYNCDFIGYMPLPVGSGNSEHGLLCVNNEYPDPHLMWPGMTEDDGVSKLSDDQIRVMQAAWGHSVVEIRKEGGAWSYVQNSQYNRRINGFTEMSDLRSGRRPCAAEDLGRSDRHQGHRHWLQLRRRHHAVGHHPHLRGRPVRHFRRRSGQGCRCQAAGTLRL